MASRRISALALALAATALQAQPAAYRSEVLPIETADLTTAAWLAGARPTTPRTIAGELSLPITQAARVPAVILLHGDGGQIANQPAWVDALNRAGFAVLSLDSLSGRGAFAKAQTFMIEGGPNNASRLIDAYRALDRLTRHPRIDPERIALMGFSGGGSVARFAAMRRFAEVHAAPGQRFAAFVALYPYCSARVRDDDKLVAAPFRVHHGSADVITSPEHCREWVERSRSASADIEFRAHDGAGHGFDMVDGFPTPPMADVPNFSRCRLREADDGRFVNIDTGQPPAISDACVGKGLSGGAQAQARSATWSAVTAFLAAALK